MGWETRRGRGRYYTRSRKVNGRVVREYVGTGPVALLAARLDALARLQREHDRTAARAERARAEALDDEIKAIIDPTDLAARAALLAAGFHQHKRQWRRRREHPQGD